MLSTEHYQVLVILLLFIPVFFHCQVTRQPLHHAQQPTTQGQNLLWIEIVVDMPSMSCSTLTSKWNSKYIHTIVEYCATSIGFEHLLGHSVPVITNISETKIAKRNHVLNVYKVH
jgi:hypothetical protein